MGRSGGQSPPCNSPRPKSSRPVKKTMSVSLRDQAIRFLVERRWPMLPSRGLQKKPCVGWKRLQEHLPTEEQLRQWDRKFRSERWGLVTGKLAGIPVVDFDGEAGAALLRRLDRTKGRQ